jgi:hypothetical protein
MPYIRIPHNISYPFVNQGAQRKRGLSFPPVALTKQRTAPGVGSVDALQTRDTRRHRTSRSADLTCEWRRRGPPSVRAAGLFGARLVVSSCGQTAGRCQTQWHRRSIREGDDGPTRVITQNGPPPISCLWALRRAVGPAEAPSRLVTRPRTEQTAPEPSCDPRPSAAGGAGTEQGTYAPLSAFRRLLSVLGALRHSL